MAQLLRAAPALQKFTTGSFLTCPPYLRCDVNSATAADMSLLHHRREVGSIKELTCLFSCSHTSPTDIVSHLSILASLPHMTGFTHCDFECCNAVELCHLVKAFPDAQDLKLSYPEGVTDVDLQTLAACKCVTKLTLIGCNSVSPMGLHALCLRLPQLCSVICEGCHQLREPALQTCKQLLERPIMLVEIRVLD